jgi:hypothetical protein
MGELNEGNMTIKLQNFLNFSKSAGLALEHGLNSIAHLVTVLAPVAEGVGMAIGQPEVAAAAKLAEVAAATTASTTDALIAKEGSGQPE